MSRADLLTAARAVVQRWRELIGKVYLETATREELEELIRAVDDHPQPMCNVDVGGVPCGEQEPCGEHENLPGGWRRLPNGDVRHHPSGFHLNVALLERLLGSARGAALDPARLPRPAGGLPWRVGRRIPIHLYDAQGHPLGTMLTVHDARRVVQAVNDYPQVVEVAWQVRAPAGVPGTREQILESLGHLESELVDPPQAVTRWIRTLRIMAEQLPP